MVEEKVNPEVVTVTKRDKLFYFKLFTGISLGLIWLVLIAIKIWVKNISLKYPLIIAGLLTFFYAMSFVGKIIANKMKNNNVEKAPEPISSDEALKIVYKTIQGTKENDYKDGYFRNIRSIGEVRTINVNNNWVYVFEVLLSEKILLNDIYTERVNVIINANNKSIRPAVRNAEITEYKLKESINDISSNPKEAPNKERRTEVDLDSGKQITYEKTTSPKENKDNEKKESVV